MRTNPKTEPAILTPWTTPRSGQGQIVDVSYARGADGRIWRRVFDGADRSESYAARTERGRESSCPGLNGTPACWRRR